MLPFDNLSDDPEQEYFSDGITEDLITDLSKVDGLFVLARNSSFALGGKPREVRELGGRLGARHVIEGSVRRAGQRVRITAQLIDAVTGGHLWAERYDRDLTDIFAVQDGITAEIVRALKIKLLPAAKPARLGGAVRSVEAYELVLRGRHLLRTDGTRRAQERARSLAAAELDAGSAEAFAGIAEAECYLHIYHGAAVAPEATRANCDRALMLDPTLVAAHAARGEAHACAGALDEAERDLKHAIALDPDLYQRHLFHGRLCILTKRLEETSRHFSRAAACRPTDAHALMMLMMCRRDLGDGRGLAAAARTGLERARAEIERRPDNATAMFQCAVAHAMRAEAPAMARLALSCDPDDLIVQDNVACVRALAGDADGAMDLLETLLPKASWHRREWLRRDMDFATLHAEPRFIALLRTHGVAAPDTSR